MERGGGAAAILPLLVDAGVSAAGLPPLLVRGKEPRCLKEVRAEDDEAYVVMLSANPQFGTVREAQEGGADGFIRKDSPRADVIAELTAIFDQGDE